MTQSRIRDVFSRVSALFSALPAISAARRISHSTGAKIPATNYTVFYRYFRAEYQYPHGTAVPVWTPNHYLVLTAIVESHRATQDNTRSFSGTYRHR